MRGSEQRGREIVTSVDECVSYLSGVSMDEAPEVV